ncbi:hypothetical protein [Streptomyces sp. NPDC018000]|uniref:hypothetical protein n=1 Tax=Streptomyces sp. NPDC018000 TaxID=3365028 RepID=UPI0037B9BFA6
MTTTIPCDSIRLTRCATGPSPRPQRPASGLDRMVQAARERAREQQQEGIGGAQVVRNA